MQSLLQKVSSYHIPLSGSGYIHPSLSIYIDRNCSVYLLTSTCKCVVLFSSVIFICLLLFDRIEYRFMICGELASSCTLLSSYYRIVLKTCTQYVFLTYIFSREILEPSRALFCLLDPLEKEVC